MNTHADKTQENKSQSVTNEVSHKQNGGASTFQFTDNRNEIIAQRKRQHLANDSFQVRQTAQLQSITGKNSTRKQQSIPQKVSPEPSRRENRTGLPNTLKSSIEALSGYSLDDVKVQYNSNKPAKLQAQAYAQGTDIHIAPGQEKHLPHEAWHVVQQKQGRVRPTTKVKGMALNDDPVLEREAEMGGRPAKRLGPSKQLPLNPSMAEIVQRVRGLSLGQSVKVHLGDDDNTIIKGKIKNIIDHGPIIYQVQIDDDNKVMGYLEHVVYPDYMSDSEIIKSNKEQVVAALERESNFRNPTQQKRKDELDKQLNLIQAQLDANAPKVARDLMKQMGQYLDTYKNEIHNTDLRIYANFLNSSDQRAAKTDNIDSERFSREGMDREGEDTVIIRFHRERQTKVLKEEMENINFLPNDSLISPAQVFAGTHLLSSYIVYLGKSIHTSGLRAVTALPPEHGFKSREWDQHKQDPTIVTEKSFGDLYTAVGRHLNTLGQGIYDFLALSLDRTYQFRFIQHGDNPQLIGHGSMINDDEQDRVASGKENQIEVLFAGQFIIGETGLEHWDNNSGHFRPATVGAQAAPLPLDMYQSGHISKFLYAKQELVALIVNWLVEEAKIQLSRSDIEDMVGGAERIDHYQIVNSYKFNDKREANKAIEALSQTKVLPNDVEEMIIEDFIDTDEFSDEYNTDLENSFRAFAKETFLAIIANIKASLKKTSDAPKGSPAP